MEIEKQILLKVIKNFATASQLFQYFKRFSFVNTICFFNFLSSRSEYLILPVKGTSDFIQYIM